LLRFHGLSREVTNLERFATDKRGRFAARIGSPLCLKILHIAIDKEIAV
jgi:hypothetical protein